MSRALRLLRERWFQLADDWCKVRAAIGSLRKMDEETNTVFSLTDAERTRAKVEPILLEAIQAHQRMNELEGKMAALGNRIHHRGGLLVSYERVAKVRVEREAVVHVIREALERIQSTGCLVKDLEMGLLDFPARLNDEEIYFCWRVGEDRIRYYHRQNEGFAARKPIDPRDANLSTSIH